ncbi:MAG TPA: hypothetical protein VD838_14085 [Anaeromyxobacteraceae bacterium]|nr:hypothetical protein [Anaeromyxobacteraceae bacterium]
MAPRSPLADLRGPILLAGGAVALGAIVVVGLFSSFLGLLFCDTGTGSTGCGTGFDVGAAWAAAKLLVGALVALALGAVATAARGAARRREPPGGDQRHGGA